MLSDFSLNNILLNSKSMDQPGKVDNPARGWLNRENENFPVRVRAREFGLARRVRQSRNVSLFISIPSLNLVLSEGILEFRSGVHIFILNRHTYAIGSIQSSSGYAITYRWCSLPRDRRHRVSKPQGSSERVLPWQATMDQLIFASPFHTHLV